MRGAAFQCLACGLAHIEPHCLLSSLLTDAEVIGWYGSRMYWRTTFNFTYGEPVQRTIDLRLEVDAIIKYLSTSRVSLLQELRTFWAAGVKEEVNGDVEL